MRTGTYSWEGAGLGMKSRRNIWRLKDTLPQVPVPLHLPVLDLQGWMDWTEHS